jgi:large subunit ribosomal protein L17
MKHGIKQRKLNRDTGHRKSLLMNLSNSLIIHGSIKTTLPKAKELRPFIEKIVTVARKNDLNSRRLVISVLKNEESVKKLFDVLAVKFKERNGGYTRIMKYGFRTGDNAPMAIIQFVE